jgi:enoyl-CoA hydratase/carnithine racemase
VRVILLDAEGPSFSAGLDRALLGDTGPGGLLGSLAAAGVEGAAARIAEFQRGFTWWAEHPAVSIAAVAGHAIGAGFQLALACDLRIIADDARFAMREVSYGLVPDLAGTAPLIAAAPSTPVKRWRAAWPCGQSHETTCPPLPRRSPTRCWPPTRPRCAP